MFFNSIWCTHGPSVFNLTINLNVKCLNLLIQSHFYHINCIRLIFLLTASKIHQEIVLFNSWLTTYSTFYLISFLARETLTCFWTCCRTLLLDPASSFNRSWRVVSRRPICPLSYQADSSEPVLLCISSLRHSVIPKQCWFTAVSLRGHEKGFLILCPQDNYSEWIASNKWRSFHHCDSSSTKLLSFRCRSTVDLL